MDSRTLGEDDESTLDRLVLRWEKLRGQGFDESIEALTEGRPDLRDEFRRAEVPPNPLLIASAENVLGHCMAKQRRFDEAEPLMIRSYPVLVGPPAWPKLDLPTRRIVQLYRDWGKPVELARWQAILDDLTFPADPFQR
jgi:hypothetical protein